MALPKSLPRSVASPPKRLPLLTHLRFLLRPISLTSLPTLAFFALTILPLSIHAQTSWTPIAPPTTQNLWSVTNGLVTTNGVPSLLFVAVGEAGTILTSPTGESGTWTLRTSGTTRWLTSVAYVTGQFIAVGEQATVLVSPDGLTWTPRTVTTNPNAPRLNALAYGNGTYLTVAEDGSSYTSPDTVTWQSRSDRLPRARGLTFAYGNFVVTGDTGAVATGFNGVDFTTRTFGTTSFIEGVIYGDERATFVAVGAEGTVFTSPSTERWTAQPLPSSASSAHLRGIAFFNHHFIAVGENGTVLTSPDATTWTPRALPSSATPLFTAVTAFNGFFTPIAIAVGHAGSIYRSTPTPAAPIAIVTPPKDVTELPGATVQFSVVATGPGPLTYQWFLDGVRYLHATGNIFTLSLPATLAPGSYSISVAISSGDTLANIPGQTAAATLTIVPHFPAPADLLDPTFVSTPFTSSPTAAVEQTDGKVVVGGNFLLLVDGAAQTGLARLNLDGSLDPSFNPGTGLSGGTSTVTTLTLQADGKALVGGTFTAVAGTARPGLARLNTNGSHDLTFSPPASLSTSTIAQVVAQPDGKILLVTGTNQLLRLTADGSLDPGFISPALPDRPINRVALASTGKIVVARGYFSADLTLDRLNSDGSPDPTFTPGRLGQPGIQFLRVLPGDRILVGTQYVVTAGQWSVYRFNADGSRDLAYPEVGGFLNRNAGRIASDATGRVVYFFPPSFGGSPSTNTFARLSADGSIDPTLRLRGPALTVPTVLLPLANGKILFLGVTTTIDGAPRIGIVRTVIANPSVINAPTIVAASPQTVSVRAGETATLKILPTGTPPLTIRWIAANSLAGVASADGTSYTLSNPQQNGLYYPTATNDAGSITGPVFLVVVEPTAPRIVAAPAALSVNSGRTAVFTVDAPGSDPRLYQWFFDRTPVGTNSPTFTVNNVTAAHAGTYTVVVRNALGTVTSAPARLTVDDTSRLANLATRGSVGTGENVLTTGFVLRGPVPRTVLIRGIGPGLTSFGVTGTVPNPSLALFDSVGTKLAENDDWNAPDSGATAALFQLCGAFALANGSADAALIRTLAPGAYTVQVSGSSLGAGAAGTTGLALAEIYEADVLPSRLVNLSSRLVVGEGASVAIPGVVIAGTVPRQLLIRAIGPALAPFGVTGFLADPRLTLTAADGTVVAANDDWSGNPNAAALVAATASVGAFALSPNSRDAALLVTVPPGSYTAQVTGSASTTGLALVEVYEVP